MSPFDALLSADEREVVELVGDVVAKHGPAPNDQQVAEVATIRTALVDAGLWTVGIPVEHGGGGASPRIRQAVYAALAREQAQAHAAAELLAADAALLARVHDGSAVTCVVDAAQWPGTGVEIV